MDHQVKVTLTALNGDLSIANRTLTLSANDHSIPVGRASKSVTKGILGAADNAWFDSPVMSRNHATIEFNPEDMTVSIQDIGSMHGTYVNDFELPKDTPTVINDGDIVVFGAEVRRGPETFPACSFRVSNDFVSYRAASTFAFPESSDVEEDGEEVYDEFSEDEIAMEGREHRYSSEDGVSVESAPRKPVQSCGAIDLTGEDFPGQPVPHQVDLTDTIDAERHIMDVLSGKQSDIDENTDPISIGVYSGNDPIVLDSEDDGEDEDVDFSSDADERSEDDVSRASDRVGNRAASEVDLRDIEESENEDSMEDSEMDSDAGFEEEKSTAAARPTVISNLTRYAVATDQSPVIHTSDIRTRVELPTSDNDENDESELDLSEAGAEGMKALYGSGSQIPDRDASEFEGENKNKDQIQFERKTSQMLSTSSQDMKVPTDAVSMTVGEPNSQANLLKPISIVRQPSPSDAAMVKTANVTRTVGIYSLGDSGDYSPQALGEKSGKPAFFAAREVNKARFGSGEPNQSMDAFQAANRTIRAFLGPSNPRKIEEMQATSHPDAGRLNGWHEPAAEQSPFATATTVFGTFKAEPSMPTFENSINAGKFFGGNTNGTGLSKTVSSIPTREYCSFLDKPDESPIIERTPSPLPDMTSSFSYNTSKGSMMSNSKTQLNARSAIKITDIVESSAPSMHTGSLKRKSDNISNVTEEELRTWANSSVSSDLPTASASVVAICGQRPNDLPSVVEAPPAKRFKKLLANAGYAVLGGATLFAALVATAPDLM